MTIKELLQEAEKGIAEQEASIYRYIKEYLDNTDEQGLFLIELRDFLINNYKQYDN